MSLRSGFESTHKHICFSSPKIAFYQAVFPSTSPESTRFLPSHTFSCKEITSDKRMSPTTFYPRAASAYPESWMVWDGACPMLEAATRFWPKPFAVRGTMIPPYRAAILNSCVLTLASQKARSFWTTPVAMRLAGSPATMLVTSCPRMQSSPTSL